MISNMAKRQNFYTGLIPVGSLEKPGLIQESDYYSREIRGRIFELRILPDDIENAIRLIQHALKIGCHHICGAQLRRDYMDLHPYSKKLRRVPQFSENTWVGKRLLMGFIGDDGYDG